MMLSCCPSTEGVIITALTTITGLQLMALAKQTHGLESHLLISDITARVGIM